MHLVRDDRRVPASPPWHPGQTTRVVLRTNAPLDDGRYALQCDLVEEGRTWFADVGSALAEIEVIVGDAPPIPSDGADSRTEPEPVMEMHAIPRATVEALLGEAGATLLDVTRVTHPGPAWLAFRYEATR